MRLPTKTVSFTMIYYPRTGWALVSYNRVIHEQAAKYLEYLRKDEIKGVSHVKYRVAITTKLFGLKRSYNLTPITED